MEFVFHLPVVRAGRLDLITEGLAKKLAQELTGDRLFLELREMPVGFQIGPVQGDFMGAVLGGAAQLDFDRRLQQESGDEERPLAAEAPLLASR